MPRSTHETTQTNTDLTEQRIAPPVSAPWSRRKTLAAIAVPTAFALAFTLASCSSSNSGSSETSGTPAATATAKDPSSGVVNLGDQGGEIMSPNGWIYLDDNPEYFAGCVLDGNTHGTRNAASGDYDEKWVCIASSSYTPRKAPITIEKIAMEDPNRVDCADIAESRGYPQVAGMSTNAELGRIFEQKTDLSQCLLFDYSSDVTASQVIQDSDTDPNGGVANANNGAPEQPATTTSSANQNNTANTEPTTASAVFANAGVPDDLAQMVISAWSMDAFTDKQIASLHVGAVPAGDCGMTMDDKAWHVTAQGAGFPIDFVAYKRSDGTNNYMAIYDDSCNA